MVLDEPDLGRIKIDDVTRERRRRARGVEDILYIAEQLVDVLTGNSQPVLLVVVELSRMPRHCGFRLRIVHDSSKC